jgi:hypothetical protein
MIDNSYRVVDRLLALAALLLARITLDADVAVGDLAGCVPSLAAIRGAAQVDFNLAPVSAVISPRLAVREHGALGRDDDTGDAVSHDAIGVGRENVGEFQQRRGAECGDGGEDQKERAEEVHGEKIG